jgi:hypothetical protein
VPGQVMPVGSEPVLVVPDDLAPIRHAHLVEPDLEQAEIVVDPVDEQVPVVGQDSLALAQPLTAPGQPSRIPHPLRGDPESRAEVVGRIGDHELGASLRQRPEQLDAVALVHRIEAAGHRGRSLRMTRMFW